MTRASRDRLIPLEDLQAIGDRYAPRVLRDFFANNGIDHLNSSGGGSLDWHVADGSTFEEIQIGHQLVGISVSSIALLKRILLISIICNFVFIWIGALGFAFFSPEIWLDLSDPIKIEEAIRDAVPSPMSSWFLVIAALIPLLLEIFACMQIITWKFFSFSKKIIYAGSSFLEHSSGILGLLAIVILAKSAPTITEFGFVIFFLEIFFFAIFIPIRTIFSLYRRSDFFDITNLHSWVKSAVAVLPPDLSASPESSGEMVELPESVFASVSSAPTGAQILKLAHASTVTNHSLLAQLLLHHHSSIPIQTELVLKNSTYGYFSCLSIQIISVPIKIFFLLDYGWNWVVLFSVICQCMAGLVRFITTIFPLSPKSVFTTNDV